MFGSTHIIGMIGHQSDIVSTVFDYSNTVKRALYNVDTPKGEYSEDRYTTLVMRSLKSVLMISCSERTVTMVQRYYTVRVSRTFAHFLALCLVMDSAPSWSLSQPWTRSVKPGPWRPTCGLGLTRSTRRRRRQGTHGRGRVRSGRSSQATGRKEEIGTS